jgi:hypothetical protein
VRITDTSGRVRYRASAEVRAPSTSDGSTSLTAGIYEIERRSDGGTVATTLLKVFPATRATVAARKVRDYGPVHA